jgi:hypothetical protein
MQAVCQGDAEPVETMWSEAMAAMMPRTGPGWSETAARAAVPAAGQSVSPRTRMARAPAMRRGRLRVMEAGLRVHQGRGEPVLLLLHRIGAAGDVREGRPPLLARRWQGRWLGAIRTNDSPWRDKRANDSGAQRLTHTRWDRTRPMRSLVLAVLAGARSIWPPEWLPRLVREARINSLSWSLVTESNRRPSPYHACRSCLTPSG